MVKGKRLEVLRSFFGEKPSVRGWHELLWMFDVWARARVNLTDEIVYAKNHLDYAWPDALRAMRPQTISDWRIREKFPKVSIQEIETLLSEVLFYRADIPLELIEKHRFRIVTIITDGDTSVSELNWLEKANAFVQGIRELSLNFEFNNENVWPILQLAGGENLEDLRIKSLDIYQIKTLIGHLKTTKLWRLDISLSRGNRNSEFGPLFHQLACLPQMSSVHCLRLDGRFVEHSFEPILDTPLFQDLWELICPSTELEHWTQLSKHPTTKNICHVKLL